SKRHRPLYLSPVKLIFHKAHPRSAHGEGGSNAREEKQPKPEQACQGGKGGSPLLKQEGHGLESHSKSGIFQYPVQTKIACSNRNNNRAAQYYFYKFVHKTCGNCVQRNVIFGPNVSGITM